MWPTESHMPVRSPVGEPSDDRSCMKVNAIIMDGKE
jgi:hypothetical protein